ncbi:hypothetical protein H0H81_007621, partial [Sphagnurus paluster]
MGREPHTPYIPPPSPPTLDHADDDLPDPSSFVSSKAQGKQRAKTPDQVLDGAHSKESGKKHARTPDDADNEAVSTSAKKPRAARSKAVSKPKAPAKVEPKVKAELKSAAAKGGRQTGSRNFGAKETFELLERVAERLPIGGSGWKMVTAKYNRWASQNNYAEREAKSLKGKFETVRQLFHFYSALFLIIYFYIKLVRTAKSKPTGVANRDPTHPLCIALSVEESIEEKARTLTINDAEFNEGELKGEDSDEEGDEVIEITDDDDPDAAKKPKHG